MPDSHKFNKADFDTRKAALEFLNQQHALATTITELQVRMTKIETAIGIIHGDE